MGFTLKYTLHRVRETGGAKSPKSDEKEVKFSEEMLERASRNPPAENFLGR